MEERSMIKAFEKNKILIPILAVGLIILNMVFWGILDKLVVPESWLSDAKLSAIVNTVQNIFVSAVFILIIKKLFGMKIGIGKDGLVRGIFLHGLVIYAFFFGVLFAVIYYRTDNLLPCIILHGIFDFISVIWICFAEDINKQTEVLNTTDTDIVSALVLIGLTSTFLISALWQLGRLFKKQQAAETETADA